MKILLTNDDGIRAEGLRVLYETLAEMYAVVVVAPDRERSAVGHGITLHEPLRVERVPLGRSERGFAVSGTPVDCVKMGVLELLEDRPDLVVSGINPGENTGINLNYSGTVAAAREAALYGIPSIAVSIQGPRPENYGAAAEFTREMIPNLMEQGLPEGTTLNVNVPDLPRDQIAGVKLSRQGTKPPCEYMEKKVDPRKREYYWHRCEFQPNPGEKDIDETLLNQKYISVTPIKCDMTDYAALETIRIP